MHWNNQCNKSMPSIQSNQSIQYNQYTLQDCGIVDGGLLFLHLLSHLFVSDISIQYVSFGLFDFFFGELSTSKPKGTRCLVSAPLALSLGAFLALCTISSVRFCKAKEGKNNRILLFSSFFFNCRGWLHDPVIFLHLEPQLFDPRLFAAFVTVILEGLKMSLKD